MNNKIYILAISAKDPVCFMAKLKGSFYLLYILADNGPAEYLAPGDILLIEKDENYFEYDYYYCQNHHGRYIWVQAVTKYNAEKYLEEDEDSPYYFPDIKANEELPELFNKYFAHEQ